MADGERRKKEGKPRNGGALGVHIGQRAPGARGVASGEGWFGPRRLDGERAERAGGAAHGGATWQLGRASGTRVSVGRCQGAGQVALRGPPAAYGGRRAKQRNREERDGGEGISAISEIPGTCR